MDEMLGVKEKNEAGGKNASEEKKTKQKCKNEKDEDQEKLQSEKKSSTLEKWKENKLNKRMCRQRKDCKSMAHTHPSHLFLQVCT